MQAWNKLIVALHFLITVLSNKMTDIKITPIGGQLDVGTRIHWDESTQSAVYVDVPNSMVYKYHAVNGNITQAKVGNESLAFMFPVEGSNTTYIAGLNRKLVMVEWDGTSPNVSKVETVAEVDTEDGLQDNRLNGAKVDPKGRLWAGTMAQAGSDGLSVAGKGSIYSLSKGKLKKHDCNIGISNGIAWEIKEKKMYYIDTLVTGVFQYDYNPDTGNISNKTQIFDFKQNNVEGLPDGLTIDSNGNLWVCAIFGSALVQFNPKNGNLLNTIKFPTPEVTSVSFGGPGLNQLYVTTAKIPINGTVPGEPAGKTFIVDNVGVTGYAGDRYKP